MFLSLDIYSQCKSTTVKPKQIKIEKESRFEIFLWQDDLLFRATLSCDGLSAKTGEFKLVFVKEKQKKESICTRDLTVDEERNIVKVLRENTFYEEKNKKTKKVEKFPLTQLPNLYRIDKIFHRNSDNSKFKSEEVTNNSFENFTAQLNGTLSKYEINNCQRRAHFFSQIFIETQYFTKTVEADNNRTDDYDPYRGRGFIHLTWLENYQRYQKHTGVSVVNTEDLNSKNSSVKSSKDNNTNCKIVSTNLEVALDTAGWYWKFGSVYGDINLIADKGTVELVTKAVQGGDGALSERKSAYQLLIKIFSQ